MKLLIIASIVFFTSCSHIANNTASIASRKIAQANQAKSVYTGSLHISSHATTDYMKATGISGNLFGHFSQAHFDEIIKKYQSEFVRQLEEEGVDLSKVLLLPIEVQDFKVKEASRRQIRSKGMFGGINEHTYKKFRADFSLNFHYLYLGNNPPQNLDKVKTDQIKIFIKRNGSNVIAEVNGNYDNLRSLSAITRENATQEAVELRVSNLNLSEEQKINLRNQVRSLLSETNGQLDEMKLSIHIEIPHSGSSIQAFVDSTERVNSKLLSTIYLKGPIARAKGSCSSLLIKLLK